MKYLLILKITLSNFNARSFESCRLKRHACIFDVLPIHTPLICRLIDQIHILNNSLNIIKLLLLMQFYTRQVSTLEVRRYSFNVQKLWYQQK